MTRNLLAAVFSSLVAGLLFAPAAAPPAAPAQASHHACLEEERRAIELGEGFGMALVADRNGYPGPRHILDLKEELELSPVQVRDLEQLFDRMQARARALGKDWLAKESEIEQLLAAGPPDDAALRRLLAESAALRADLRWVHLSAHLEARSLLTPEQRHAYHAARYASSVHAH
jgi:Spy/CpxP family protein refolding chaperone